MKTMSGKFDTAMSGSDPVQDLGEGLPGGTLPVQYASQDASPLRDILAAIDPEDIAELRQRNKEQME